MPVTTHDYEDMLQVNQLIFHRLILSLKGAIPLFDGLLPEPLQYICLKLLFNLAPWHTLDTLRVPTDATLDISGGYVSAEQSPEIQGEDMYGRKLPSTFSVAHAPRLQSRDLCGYILFGLCGCAFVYLYGNVGLEITTR